MTSLAATLLISLEIAAGPAVRGHARGSATFRHGGRSYRLPLERVDLEEIRAPGRAETHVSLVYRDARNRVLALAFVHRGPGPLRPPASIDLTVSTAAGTSRFQSARSSCDIEISAAGAAAVAGRGRCGGLTDFSGERGAPDVAGLRFAARGRSP